MRLERVRPTITQVTMHTFELAALMASARWVAEGCPGELPDEAVEHLKGILDSYDRELAHAGAPAGPESREP
jgi:hypothetical protein